jgi:LuxR family maltose regulon positive regulatory protein
MPKATRYRLTWVGEHQIYALREAHNTEQPLPVTPGSVEWFSWLSRIPSFTFSGQHGQLTVRQEARGGARTYWYAYRRHGDKMLKRYLGRTADLTPAHLEEVALQLTALSVSAPKQGLSAKGPSQERGPAQGKYLRSSPKDEGASLWAASPPSEPSPARQTAHPTFTAPHALHHAHNDVHVPLLATKLHLPRPRAQLVPRSHLVERLQQGVAGTLTLLSAPAGYGKTTLLAQWGAATRAPVAWLSLEPEDNEPIRFLTYFIAALQTLDPRLGASAQALLERPQPAEPATVLALLANDLIGGPGEDFALVLDDYHVITAEPIHRTLTHLVEHQPSQMHLIIATRSDPPLPLARLRAGGQLTELRAAKFRFGAVEAGAFLAEVMGLHLSHEEVTTLLTRTEGWIAGLQLAALWLQGRANASDLLSAFTGSHRFVLDYLSEEVLSRQPAEVQTFLLQTSVLERLSGSLCEAVTGHEESQAMLEELERANLFVIALDDVRGWYRYHQLFADLLRSRLSQAMPALLPDLHQRASTWYEEQGLILDAVHHAILAPDLERTSRLLEEHRHSLALHGQARTVLAWLHAFPEELLQRHPRLWFSQALLLMLTSQLPQALMRLQAAEQAASHLAAGSEAQIFLHQVATLQAYILFLQGDLESSVALAEQASGHLAEMPEHVHEAARVIAAHRSLVSGDVSRVGEQHMARLPSALSIGNDWSAMEMFVQPASILLQARQFWLQGRLRQAAATYGQLAQIPSGPEGALIHPGYCFGVGELCYEWNDLDTAEHLLEQGREALHGPLTLAGDSIAQGYATLARLHQARHNNAGARALVEELVRLAESRQFATAQLAAARAVRARLDVMQGDLAAAVRWTEASGLSASDDPCYPREREYLTFAWVRIAQGREDPAGPHLPEALRLLERRRSDAEEKARLGSILEILILQALALSAGGTGTEALPVLERILTLAEPEGYIRLFVDEGEAMVALLRQAYARGIASDYVATLLSAAGAPGVATPASARSLLEPLTERELEVLRLLANWASRAAPRPLLAPTPCTCSKRGYHSSPLRGPRFPASLHHHQSPPFMLILLLPGKSTPQSTFR